MVIRGRLENVDEGKEKKEKKYFKSSKSLPLKKGRATVDIWG